MVHSVRKKRRPWAEVKCHKWTICISGGLPNGGSLFTWALVLQKNESSFSRLKIIIRVLGLFWTAFFFPSTQLPSKKEKESSLTSPDLGEDNKTGKSKWYTWKFIPCYAGHVCSWVRAVLSVQGEYLKMMWARILVFIIGRQPFPLKSPCSQY